MSTSSEASSLLGIGGLGSAEHFSNHIDGIYGTFSTPAGEIFYLQTKAKLAADGSNHAQLTKALVPAREALNIQEMDFNQLLQRDLDDHRIATKLIPYILDPPPTSLPSFFPPIVAVLLPFNHKQQPIEYFEIPTEKKDIDHYYEANFRMITHGKAYRIQYLLDKNDQPHSLTLGVLRWNPDIAKLVIMDGQHRAMALLAIERTINKSWSAASKGARYQPFYEQTVEKYLADALSEGHPVDLSNIELPVTICWFPENPGQDPRPRPHMAARKLFVDVNNTAKPPSEARLVLLSDTKLENIFARELLNQLRNDSQWHTTFPLYGVEYDNPDAAITTPKRWSVATNLEILKDAVVRSVFGPPKLIENMGASLAGKPPQNAMNAYMRSQLKVDDLFTTEFHDGPRLLKRQSLGNDNFPIIDVALHNKLLKAFYEKWGKGILYLISHVDPYKAHLEALRDRYSSWNAADNIQTLAKDALFEGVGMFWTIEDGHQLWLSQKQEARENKKKEPDQPDISKAWLILEKEQKKEFKNRRSVVYLGSSSETDLEDCDQLFRSLITYAAQVGLILAWASIHKEAAPEKDPFKIAIKITEAINKSINSGPTTTRNRKLILLKNSRKEGFKPFNQLPKLDQPYATYFRYLWLEILLMENNLEELKKAGIDIDKAKDLLNNARQVYLKFLIEERRKFRLRDTKIRDMPFDKQYEEALRQANQEVIEEQAQARNYWFGEKIKSCRALIKSTLEKVEVTDDSNGEEENGEDPEALTDESSQNGGD